MKAGSIRSRLAGQTNAAILDTGDMHDLTVHGPRKADDTSLCAAGRTGEPQPAQRQCHAHRYDDAETCHKGRRAVSLGSAAAFEAYGSTVPMSSKSAPGSAKFARVTGANDNKPTRAYYRHSESSCAKRSQTIIPRLRPYPYSDSDPSHGNEPVSPASSSREGLNLKPAGSRSGHDPHWRMLRLRASASQQNDKPSRAHAHLR